MNTRAKALLAVIAGNTIFGFSFIFSRMALQITVPSVLIAVRFLTAFLVLNLIVLVGRRIRIPLQRGPEHEADRSTGLQSEAGAGPANSPAAGPAADSPVQTTQEQKPGNPSTRPLVEFSLRGKPLRNVLLLALFQPILYFLCESYGIVYTSSSFAGTIIAVIPIAGIAFDVVIMHSSVRRKQIICAVLSAVGVAITTIGAEGMRSSVLGLLILLGAVAAGALFYPGDDCHILADYCMSRQFDEEDYAAIQADYEAFLQEMTEQEDALSGDYNTFWDERNYTNGTGNLQCSAFIVHGLNDFNVKTKQFDMMVKAFQTAGRPVSSSVDNRLREDPSRFRFQTYQPVFSVRKASRIYRRTVLFFPEETGFTKASGLTRRSMMRGL